MAKEVIQGEVVEILDDDGPEEGEIEDDTSEEEIIEKNEFRPSNTTDVIATAVGLKYYRPPSSSKTEIRNGKSKIYSEDKKETWRSSSRRHYKFYVDHDKPTRDSYDRLIKSDMANDHRGINFHELLKDYKTSKHGNEGNSHEKENRHYAKEVRVDSSRKRDSGLSDTQEGKIKRNRKRKHHRSPSHSPVSSGSDVVRKRKDSKAVKQKKKKKLTASIRNHNESAALFAQIRAKRNSAIAAEQQKSKVEIINVPSEGENVNEVSEKCISSVRSAVGVSEVDDGKSDETRTSIIEFQLKDSSKLDSSKSLCSASDSQNAEKVEDSESKDEDDDENQLRMIALQSAFRAKFLERKRRGFIVRKQTRRTMPHISPKESNLDAGFNLEDTADMLEAAVEEAVACCTNKEALDFSEAWQPSFSTLLSEVPLPPDDPPSVSPVEDLTPVDMELALTDEEENTDKCQLDENGFPTENLELSYPKIRFSHSSLKTRNIPVTIGGRIHPFKSRQRMSNCVDNARRSNLLEVRTYSSEGLSVEDLDSCLVGMAGVDMGSMIVLDAVGTCSSPEAVQGVEDEVLSEASDFKGDFTQPQSSQGCIPENDIDDEDEELLRARLLLDISSRHRSESLVSNSLKPDVKLCNSEASPIPICKIVSATNATAVEPKTPVKINGKNSIPHVATVQAVKLKTPSKKNIERARREQLLAKARGRQAGLSSNGQVMVSPFMKSYLSKISNRGKFQRVNQNRMAVGKKRIDGNLQVTVVGSGGKTKAVSKIPQHQDRIVICLGDDSDESEDEKQNVLTKIAPVISKVAHLPEKQTSESASHARVVAMNNPSDAPEKSTPGFPAPSVSIDFEKSVDLFLKEVRSGQESKSKGQPVMRESQMKKVFATPKHTLSAVSKITGNGPKIKPAKLVAKSASGVTPQAVRHLPALQQEEYRRLKMQISVLEEKKRKAAEVLQGSSKGGNVAIKQKVGSTTPDTSIKTTSITGSSSLSKEKMCDAKVSSEGLKELKENIKAVDSGSDKGSSHVVEDADDEDVNLMREQLLKSTLHKKIHAKSENSSLKREVTPVVIEETPHGSAVMSNSEEVHQGLETGILKENIVPFKKDTQPSNVAIVPSGEDYTLKMDKVEPNEKVVPKTQQIPTTRVFNSEEIVSVPSKCDYSSRKTVDLLVKSDQNKVEGGVPKRGVFLNAQEIIVSRKCLNMTESVCCGTNTSEPQVEVCDSLSKNVDEESGSISLLRISREMDSKRGKEVAKAGDSKSSTSVPVKDVGVQSLAISPRSTVAAKNARSASAPVFQENQDTRASELMELEYKLLSERHAALKYLSELSNLLTKMEIEGARLRQKEIAAQKLRAELAAAETSISTQKDYLKQLAQNISSTHERVSTTRQRCSVLFHACMILGNQIKKDKRVNGGLEAGDYCVPTGGAALVKSQLSSVLVKTKQLKKAGLPFLRGQNFNTRVKYPIQKGPVKQTGNSQGQSSAVPWTNPVAQSFECLKINTVEKPRPIIVPTSVGIPEIFSGTVTNLPAPKSALVLKTTSKSKTDCIQSLSVSKVRKTVPVSRSVLTPGKFVYSSSSTLPTHAASSSYTSNSSAKVEVQGVSIIKLSENVVQSVPVTPSSLLKDSACSGAKSPGNVSSAKQVVTSDVEKPTTSSESVMESMPLKVYHSPLEPFSARPHLEDLAVTSESSMLLEDSVMLDPNIILCPYDLMGECQDEECAYQHQRRKRVVKES